MIQSTDITHSSFSEGEETDGIEKKDGNAELKGSKSPGFNFNTFEFANSFNKAQSLNIAGIENEFS